MVKYIYLHVRGKELIVGNENMQVSYKNRSFHFVKWIK